MNITIKPEAKEYLDAKVGAGDRLFIALDDGSSKYSKLGGSCAIGNKFQLVLSRVGDADYNIPVENDTDVEITTGEQEMIYLGQGLSLGYRLGQLTLSDNSGMLDGAVTVERVTPLTEDEMKTLGGRIC